MAASRIKGITVVIDGETKELQKELKSVNKEIKTTQDQLRDVEKLLKLDPGNTDLLKQKQKLLAQEIEATKNKLKQEKDALAQLSSQDSTPEVEQHQDALQREIIETENKLKSLQQQADRTATVMGQKMELAGSKIKAAGESITSAGQAMMPVSAATAALGAVALDTASDYEENLNKIDVAFENSADKVTDWANNARDEFGLSKVAASSAVSSFGALAKGVGVASKDAADMSTTLAGLSADLASYFNTSNEDAAKALEGIFTGESEALKRFGVVMLDTNLADFAEQQGKVWKEMSQAEKTTLRYQYVLEKTKDAQGDYARTSDGTANSMKTLQAALEDLGVAIGTQLIPIITPIIQQVTNLINKLADLPEPVQKIITYVGLIVAVLGPILVIVGSIISAVGTITSAVGALASSSAIAAIGTFFTGTLLPALAAVGQAIMGIVAAIGGTLLAAIGLVIAAVAIWIKNWEYIKQLPEGIAWMASQAFNAIKEKVTEVGTAIKERFLALVEKAKTWGADLIQGLVDGIRSKISAVAGAAKAIADKIRSYIHFSQPDEGPLADFNSYMPDMIKGLANGIKANVNGLDGAMTTLGNKLNPTTAVEVSYDKALGGQIANLGNAISGIGQQSTEVVIEGDMAGLFKAMRKENGQFKRANARSAF